MIIIIVTSDKKIPGSRQNLIYIFYLFISDKEALLEQSNVALCPTYVTCKAMSHQIQAKSKSGHKD